MKIFQKHWHIDRGWEIVGKNSLDFKPDFVLAFSSRHIIESRNLYEELKNDFSNTHIIIASTAGEIIDGSVFDDSVVVTAIKFEKSKIRIVTHNIDNSEQSLEVGESLAKDLFSEDLRHILLFSDGLLVNGTALVAGMNSVLQNEAAITGGLVGDGADFKKTILGLDSEPKSGLIVGIGIYGGSLKVGYGSLGGWDPFGIERTITKSKNNILYELDGKSALDIYKEYLGELADGLPGTGLLFPIRLRNNNNNQDSEVVRTLLGIESETGGMIFAGDMPEGSSAMLMKANFERLIDGASGAGSLSVQAIDKYVPDFGLLVSCIGRKLVLKDRVEDEIEAVRGIIGIDVPITGFYSYGELCPTSPTDKQCRLHNQTMTVTVFKED